MFMLKKLLIITVILSLVIIPFSLRAQDAIQITMVKVAIRNDYFVVYWKTNVESVGTIKYGISKSFESSVTDKTLSKVHETTIAGVIPKKKYYFQLEVFNANGDSAKSSIYQIDTADESDADPPTITNVSSGYVTGNYAQIVWQTNEDASGCVALGLSYDNLKRKICDGNNKRSFDLFIDKLSPGTEYIFQIIAKDKKGNEQYSTYYRFSTIGQNDGKISDLEIIEMVPEVGLDNKNQTKVNLRILAKRPIEGKVSVGEQSGKYKWTYNLPKPRSALQIVTLDNLQADKDYFYKVEITDVFKKRLTAPEFRFRTLPSQNLIVVDDETRFVVDRDNDGLSDDDEKKHGTDPLKPDTDSDGYLDGVEVRNGFNPLGPGRLVNGSSTNLTSEVKPEVKIFAYGQARKDSRTETAKAKELKTKLMVKFGGNIPVHAKDWPNLVNAYIYGGYPVEAVYKSIIFGGKTVHPTIIWEKWRQTDEYKAYINKERVITNNKLKFKK